MAIKDLNNLSKNLLKRVRSTSSNLQGPIFTEYEFGLSPTLSFWSEKGRVHFYYFEQNRADYLIAEVAYLDPTLESRQTLIETRDEAWRILAQFLQQDYPITEVSEYSWLEIDTRRDWFIPRPPSDVEQKNSLSILVDLTAQHYLFLILWEWLGGISQIMEVDLLTRETRALPALANDIENFKKHIDFEFYLDMSERTTDKVQKLGYGSKQETIVVELKQHQKTLRDFYDELDRLITVDQEAETEEILDWLSFIVNRMNELAAHMHTAADNLKPIIEKLRKLINGMENGVG